MCLHWKPGHSLPLQCQQSHIVLLSGVMQDLDEHVEIEKRPVWINSVHSWGWAGRPILGSEEWLIRGGAARPPLHNVLILNLALL